MVSQGNSLKVHAVGGLDKKLVPQVARSHFNGKAVLVRKHFDVAAARNKRQMKFFRRSLNERLIGIALRSAQKMVEMSDMQLPGTDTAEEVQQDHGIDTAGNSDEHAFARFQQVLLKNGFLHAINEIHGKVVAKSAGNCECKGFPRTLLGGVRNGGRTGASIAAGCRASESCGMKNAKLILAVCASGMLMACGGNGDQISTAQNESGEGPNFGSATDVVSKDGTEISTNKANVADIGIGGPISRESGNYESQPMQGQASDRELEKKIRVALTTGSVGTTGLIAEDQLTKIQVQAQDGNVTLTGPVASEGEKESVERQVAGMKGVKSVKNQLTVGPKGVNENSIQSPLPRTPGNQ